MSLAFDPSRRKNQLNSPWAPSAVARLYELWKSPSTIECVASALRTEFGYPFTWRAVHRKAQRLNLIKRSLTPWTAEADARLAELWPKMSGAAIAPKLSDEFSYNFTRNSIIARATRLRLKSEGKSRGGGSVKGRPRKAVTKRPAGDALQKKIQLRRIAPQIEDWSIPTPQRKTLLELGQHDCRWPIGEPKSDSFFFCGAAAENDRPYCSSHCQRAYVEIRPR